jgi:hypothetical protein
VYEAFLERAKIEVDFVRSEDGRLKAEQENLERRLAEIKYRRQLISDVDVRLQSYTPSSEHCPVCHIRGDSTDSNPIKLHPIPSGSKFDFFACSHCGVSIEVKL